MNKDPVEVKLVGEFFEEDGTFCLFPVADIPIKNHIASMDRFVLEGDKGWVVSQGLRFPMKSVLPAPFRTLYKHDRMILRYMMPEFILSTLPALRHMIEVDISPTEDLFRFVPDKPEFRLKLSGTENAISVLPFACYGKHAVLLGSNTPPNTITRPDPDDMLLYHMRNPAAERAALILLRHYGFTDPDIGPKTGRLHIYDRRGVLNFLGTGLASLRRRGWRFELDERLDNLMNSCSTIVPVVKIVDAPDGAFDVGYTFDADGVAVSDIDIQQAINCGNSFILRPSKKIFVDTEAISEMRAVFNHCGTTQGGARKGFFRVAGVYAPYVKSSIEALEAIDLDCSAAPNWKRSASSRVIDDNAKWAEVPLGPLDDILRPYQKTGVYWLSFLEKCGLSGLLADEMGLGKTLQTLTWISLERHNPFARGKPALVVCPTSLVANWDAEAEKFTPWLKRLVISGANRFEHFDEVSSVDLVITSYSLLQRDLEEVWMKNEYSVVVLDEAQHIKNRSTRNAKAAKALRSINRLVLTGTPVENSVADVWSIFDFLQPNYLGTYHEFKSETEDPISNGGEIARMAQIRLRNMISPFILRRLKEMVAKDLPEKIISIRYCTMTADQQRWYNKVLEQTRAKIGDTVREKGFEKSRFEILALLMRLRQIANDLALLKEFRESGDEVKGAALSGKLSVFFELLDEAIDAGHRVLVFSQFVSMLSILEGELKSRGIRYCYLDGSTTDRLGECRKFNTDETIPLFLISLKAGGTGLNLTGADMVVHFDPWWNPAVEAQATDRAHRIGQKKTVYVVKMIASHTIEERVLFLQQRKQKVIDATVSTSDQQLMEQLTYEDVRSMLL